LAKVIRAARDRAERLHDLGLGPRPGPLRHGFLELPLVPGQPLTACRDRIDAREVVRYIGTVARAFPAGAPADTSMLEHMIDTNVRELLEAVCAEGFQERARRARHSDRRTPAVVTRYRD
jgi:hypothetical protein